MPGRESGPDLEFVVDLRVDIGPMLDLGLVASGKRRSVPITGGTFTGPLLSGRVLPGGADWQIIENDGLTFVDARYVLETDDLARIEVKNRGIRHGARDLMDRISAGDFVSPEHYYFRTAPQFDVPAGKYDWLRRSIFIGIGERYLNFVAVRVWRVR